MSRTRGRRRPANGPAAGAEPSGRPAPRGRRPWLRRLHQLAVGVADWAYVLPHWAACWLPRRPVETIAPRGTPCGAPVVVLPGVLENWRFQLPLARGLATRGHEVHLLPQLGANLATFPDAAAIVAAELRRRALDDVVVVAHSKGGLVAKELLLDPETTGRLRGVVAVGTPFSGSTWARVLPARTMLGAFSPRGLDLGRLLADVSVNDRIVSLSPAWDEVIPEGSHLAGAHNVTLNRSGHFLPLVHPDVHEIVHAHVDSFERITPMRIIAIAIVDADGVLGDGRAQPFEFAEDWARYKRVTLGHPMIMGRATHDAIGRWLPGRTTIVVTRRPDAVQLPTDGRATGYAVSSVEDALALARSLDDVVYVAGGGTIYRALWDALTELDLTEVHARADVAADKAVRLPEVRPDEWREVRREPRGEFDFVGYERVPRASST